MKRKFKQSPLILVEHKKGLRVVA